MAVRAARLLRRRALVGAVSVAICAAIAWQLLPQVSRGARQLDDLPAPDWRWIVILLAAISVSYLFSALSLSLAAGRRLPLGRNVLVQFAAAAANRVTPASAGGLVINTRFLLRQGLSIGEAGAAVTVRGLAYVVVAIGCLATLGPSVAVSFGTRLASAITDADTGWPAIGGLAIALLALAGLRLWRRRGSMVARCTRSPMAQRLLPPARAAVEDALHTMRQLAHSPMRSALLLLLAAAVKAANVFALLTALWAFHGDVGTWRVAVVYLVGVTTAEAVPVPAGIGTVDAALLAGLVGAGATAGATLAAVIVFRLLTFWAPVLPGVVASGVLRRRMAI
jgi:uncharacterized protein (TIRG00374 family)